MPFAKRAAGLAAALTLLTAIACEVEIGGFSVSAGPDAPSYPITLYQGAEAFGGAEQVEFDEAKAAAPLVVYYFNGQCEHCLGELFRLQAVAEEYGDALTVLAVDMGPVTGEGDSEDAKAMLAQAATTFPAGYTLDESVPGSHEIEGTPTVAFYSDGGHYRKKLIGILLEEDLREAVKEIVG